MKRLELNRLVGRVHHLQSVKDSHSTISMSNPLTERMEPTPAVTWSGTTRLARRLNSDDDVYIQRISALSIITCPRAPWLDVVEK